MKKILSILAVSLILPVLARAQDVQAFSLQIIPNTALSTPGTATFLDAGGVNGIALTSPTSLSGVSYTLTLPKPTGSVGCVQDSTGAGVLIITGCGLTYPFSGSYAGASTMITFTDSGTGDALSVFAQGSGTNWAVLGTNSATTGGVGVEGSSAGTGGAGIYGITSSASGFGGHFTAIGGGTALYADGIALFGSNLTGTHAQNIGTGDGPTFSTLTITGASNMGETSMVGGSFDSIGASGSCVPNACSGVFGTTANVNSYGVQARNTGGGTALYANGPATMGGIVTFNSTLTGTHAQNLGTGDTPTFNGISTPNTSSSVIYVGSGNFYNRTFSGAPGCGGVTDGWMGYDTTGDHLYICSGGALKTH